MKSLKFEIKNISRYYMLFSIVNLSIYYILGYPIEIQFTTNCSVLHEIIKTLRIYIIIWKYMCNFIYLIVKIMRFFYKKKKN